MTNLECARGFGGRRFACAAVSMFVALAGTGCEVPQAPASAADESRPPDPVYVQEDSKEFRKIQAARAKTLQPPPAADTGDAVAAAVPAGGDAAAAAGSSGAAKSGDGSADAGDGDDAGGGGGKLVAAEAGAGKRTPLAPGIITTSINAYFSAKQRMAFNQVVQGLKYFHARNGRKPKDFDEVTAKIIKPGGIRLPPLKPGDKYVFDPNEGPDGAIMIQKK